MGLIEKYLQVRKDTEDFCAPLSIEDYIPQIADFASPVKWQIAHTTWFFEEFILSKYLKGYQAFHPQFSFLFNSYYNNVGERTVRSNRGAITRPSVEEVFKYRAYVDKHVVELLQNEISKEIEAVLLVGINHEQQHQELIKTDLKYNFGSNPIYPVYKDGFDLVSDKNIETGFVKIEEGIYEIGHKEDSFCYDNELDVHKTYIQPFEISKALVTNKEYIEFIEAGGYQDFNLWLDEGWHWVNNNKVQSPLYWEKIDGVWHHYTFGGLKTVDLDAILCHISFYEAQAFATWKGMRLPTEFEWEVASSKFDWGKRWEWTNSAYLPYPNFKIAEGALGEYNGKFMINQMVLRGASTATSKNHSRKTYRNFFHPKFQWQFTGIRLVK